MATALRRLAGNSHHKTATTNLLLRSLTGTPSYHRINHHNNNDNHHPTQPLLGQSQIPPLSRPASFSNVFDPLAPSTRSKTQDQPMNQLKTSSYNPFLSASGIMGIGAHRVTSRVIQNALHLNLYKNDSIKVETRRSYSSIADEKIQTNANITRPLSPHLPIYKPQTNSVASIFNRISASYLTAFAVVFYLMTIQLGPVYFTYYPFYQLFFYSAKLFLISAELAGLALAYHLFHSFPHLFSDIKAVFFLKKGGRN